MYLAHFPYFMNINLWEPEEIMNAGGALPSAFLDAEQPQVVIMQL